MYLTSEEFREEVAKEILLRSDEAQRDERLVSSVAKNITNRLSLYLGLKPDGAGEYRLDARMVDIAGDIGLGVFRKAKELKTGVDDDTSIKSISDNGQSITYGDTVKHYLATTADNEVFGGAVEQLKSYRRVDVIA